MGPMISFVRIGLDSALPCTPKKKLNIMIYCSSTIVVQPYIGECIVDGTVGQHKRAQTLTISERAEGWNERGNCVAKLLRRRVVGTLGALRYACAYQSVLTVRYSEQKVALDCPGSGINIMWGSADWFVVLYQAIPCLH